MLTIQCVRDGSLSPELFARLQRSKQALLVTLVEMVVQGVSTRKASAVAEERRGTEVSKFPVSDRCKRAQRAPAGGTRLERAGRERA